MAQQTRTKAGIREIAAASGVSQATVSQVLGNGKRPVRAETRERIEQTARELGYHPNALARGLAKNRINTLGVVIHHDLEAAHTNPTLTAILDGILSAATRHQQHTNIVTYACWADAEASLPTLTDGRCDGIILVVPPRDTALIPALLESGLPFVLIGAHSEAPGVSCVDIDNIAAAEKMVSYLLSQGHRRIAFFSSVTGAHQFVDERVIGYRRALESAGITFDSSLVATEDEAHRCLTVWRDIAYPNPPTAIFCVTDADALSAMHFFTQCGIRVPEDVSIAGFDDIPSAALSIPPLTTVRQPSACAGEQAAEMLLNQINGHQESEQTIYLPTELMLRSSIRRLASS